MLEETKRTYKSWGISLGLHALVLVAIASTGLFNMVLPKEKPDLTDVEIYEMATASPQELESAQSEAAATPPPPPPSIDQQIILPDPTAPTLEELKEEEKLKEQKKDDNRLKEDEERIKREQAEADAKAKAEAEAKAKAEAEARAKAEAERKRLADLEQKKKELEERKKVVAVNGYLNSPSFSLPAGKHGSVHVSAVVSPDGSIESVEASDSNGDSSVEAIVTQAIYVAGATPGYNEFGEPVRSRVRGSISY